MPDEIRFSPINRPRRVRRLSRDAPEERGDNRDRSEQEAAGYDGEAQRADLEPAIPDKQNSEPQEDATDPQDGENDSNIPASVNPPIGRNLDVRT